jgi:translation elongation factor EF-G
VPAIQGVDAADHDKAVERHSSDAEPFSALAFKIMNDPFVGETALPFCGFHRCQWFFLTFSSRCVPQVL